MATTALPSRPAASRGRWLWAGVAVIIVATIAGLLLSRGGTSAAAPQVETTTVAAGSVVASVSGSGAVAAARSLDLGFQTGGTVAKVLVAEGDAVAAGQPLAQLDSRDLELQVASAQAQVDSAKVKLAQSQEGDVKPADLDAQRAAVASAQAQLASAQAQLDALRHPTADKISSAEKAVRQAELDLQSQKDSGSATKTKAEQDLQKAVDSLTQAQSKYATAKQNWDFVSETGQDPTNPETTDSKGKTVKNKLSDTQRQQYYDTFVQAEAALRSAEASVRQAQVSYDSARSAEPIAIQQAEAKLADAQAQLQALRNPGRNDIAQKQAAVDQARAGLEQAQANLAKLTAPGTASDVAVQQLSVTQAEQSLRQAQLKLDQATLRAPFDGVVTAVDAVAGGSATAGKSAVSLIDRSTLHVDLKLSENDVARVRLGQKVDLTIDALKGWAAQGQVSYIAPAAQSSNGVVTYAVRVSFPDADDRVKVGMTANLTITTDRKDGALLVPNSALLPKGAGHVVQVLGADGKVREVDVETGLSDGASTEVVSGLKPGDRVVTAPGSTTTPKRNGLFG